MTLGFMQNWPKYMGMQNEKTHFVQKIWNSLLDMDYDTYSDYLYPDGLPNQLWNVLVNYKHNVSLPKIHTIRRDENERWKPGMDIHFVINSRTKDRFQFAPVVKCTSVQTIEISCANHLSINDEYVSYYGEIELYGEKWGYALNVKIDGRQVGSIEVETLAKNDGFDSVYDFYKYFDKEFKGRLIHWTNLRY